MTTTWMRWLGPALMVALLAIAGWILWHQLAGLDLLAVGKACAALAPWRLGLAAGLLCLSFCAYGWLERLALGHLGHVISFPRALALAVVAQGLSLTTGKGFVIAGAVRVRVLGRWGYTLADSLVATVIVTLHGNAGMLVLMSALCWIAGPWTWSPWVGLGTLALVLLWLVACRYAAPVTFAKTTVTLPTISAALRGIVAGGIEKLACIGMAAVLQPASLAIPIPTFMAVVVVAMAAARISQVPGGIGVLEASILALWPVALTDAAKVDLIAGLLAFRVAYYLLPLVAAIPTLVFINWRRRVSP